MIEFESGPDGIATAFRLGRFLVNMFLNFFHFCLWFICLWLLLRFQWSHALGLAFVMWIAMSLAVLPMLFEQTAHQNVTTSAATASLSPVQFGSWLPIGHQGEGHEIPSWRFIHVSAFEPLE